MDKAQKDTAMADGEIRKVDTDNKKITIKHGEIKNLDMPPMTMVFQVKDDALLGRVTLFGRKHRGGLKFELAALFRWWWRR